MSFNSQPPPIFVPEGLEISKEHRDFYNLLLRSVYDMWQSLGGTKNGVIPDGRISLISRTTDDIKEGDSNIYYTEDRFDASFSNKDTDDLSEGSTNLYHTSERVDDRVSNLLVAGDNISLTYDDLANTLTIGNTLSGSLLDHAKDVISQSYSHTVSFSQKGKDLLKFGRNPNVGTSKSTIWYTGQDDNNETYLGMNTNSIDSISSSSSSDTEVVRIEGHTESGDDKTFVIQTATLNGQNRVALTTALNRITRISHNNDSSTDLVGEIYGYENTGLSSGKPTDTTKIHITIPSGENQSQKASTSLSSVDYWVVSSITANYLEKSGTNIAEVTIEVRESGGVFKPIIAPVVISTGVSKEITFEPYVIIKPNSDVRLTAVASANNQEISGEINGFLAVIT